MKYLDQPHSDPRNERSAHAALSDTAKLKRIDALHGEITTERRKQPREGRPLPTGAELRRQRHAEKMHEMIETGIWPVYTP